MNVEFPIGGSRVAGEVAMIFENMMLKNLYRNVATPDGRCFDFEFGVDKIFLQKNSCALGS